MDVFSFTLRPSFPSHPIEEMMGEIQSQRDVGGIKNSCPWTVSTPTLSCRLWNQLWKTTLSTSLLPPPPDL